MGAKMVWPKKGICRYCMQNIVMIKANKNMPKHLRWTHMLNGLSRCGASPDVYAKPV